MHDRVADEGGVEDLLMASRTTSVISSSPPGFIIT
jgi:hypothetical protein